MNLTLNSYLPPHSSVFQKLGSAIASLGFLGLLIAWAGVTVVNDQTTLSVSLTGIGLGIIIYSIGKYAGKPAGIKNDGVWFASISNRGILAWMVAIFITGIYILLYWYPQYLGLNAGGNSGLVALFDPLSNFLKGKPASQWFLYGTLYTMAILLFGVKFIFKYRHNKYQILRTISVMFFQLGFAFLLPEFLQRLNYPYNDFKNMWPLNYYFFDGYNIEAMTSSGNLGLFMLFFGIAMIFVISPLLTYFYGKRWYCSWVCGCGGLAETAGDPFRHLSDKSMKAWKIERWLIHSVLVFVTLMTMAVIYSYLHDHQSGYWINKQSFSIAGILFFSLLGLLILFEKKYMHDLDPKARRIGAIASFFIAGFLILGLFLGTYNLFLIDNYQLRSTYGFLVGAAFSGVIGVGFYPIMGSRVWCRFGCPMAAVLGIQQRFFSRFRITSNGGQCISCGNCSTYCEMGIDVRAYAEKGQNIVRASCVGCGICSAVCPRGVLRLENGSVDINLRTQEKKAVFIK